MIAKSVGLTTTAARAVLSLATTAGGQAAGPVGGLSGQVAQRLREAIQLGILLDGERLPPEASLAEQLGVATVTLREALAVLREQGLVTTRRGRGGGTFVTAADLASALGRRLREFSVAGLRDLGDHRGAITATTARLAAQRAIPAEVTDLECQLDRLRTARGASDRRRAAQQFSVALAAAAQSPRLLAEELRLSAEIGDLLWLQASDDDHRMAVAVRARLVAAIEARDGATAADVAHQQVAAETARLTGLRLNAYRADPPGRSPAAQSRLSEVGESLERLFGVLENLGLLLADLCAPPGVAPEAGAPQQDDLAKLRPAIFGLLASHRDLAAGAGVITAPNVLADAPLWLEWWWTNQAGSAEPLRVNLDPAAPDFFDYTTAAWYTAAERLHGGIPGMPGIPGGGAATGPYVDYFCTGEYTLTLSVPVRVDGRFIGVAAADVLVSNLEGQVLPALLASGRPVALTSPEGRVIAATTAGLVPGARMPTSGATPVPSPLVRWRLAEIGRPGTG